MSAPRPWNRRPVGGFAGRAAAARPEERDACQRNRAAPDEQVTVPQSKAMWPGPGQPGFTW